MVEIGRIKVGIIYCIFIIGVMLFFCGCNSTNGIKVTVVAPEKTIDLETPMDSETADSDIALSDAEGVNDLDTELTEGADENEKLQDVLDGSEESDEGMNEFNLEYMNIAVNQFVALADSEEEALKIAEDYGISLVSYKYGVAEYHTDEDINEVFKRGSGKYKLHINHVNTIQ